MFYSIKFWVSFIDPSTLGVLTKLLYSSYLLCFISVSTFFFSFLFVCIKNLHIPPFKVAESPIRITDLDPSCISVPVCVIWGK